MRLARGQVTIGEVRCILAATAVSMGTYGWVLVHVDEVDPLGRWFAPVLFFACSLSSLACAVRPTRLALIGSALGLVAGLMQRALIVPIQITDGTLDIDSVRAYLPPSFNTFVAAVMAFVWARVFVPVVEHDAALRRARRDA